MANADGSLLPPQQASAPLLCPPDHLCGGRSFLPLCSDAVGTLLLLWIYSQVDEMGDLSSVMRFQDAVSTGQCDRVVQLNKTLVCPWQERQETGVRVRVLLLPNAFGLELVVQAK